MIELCHICNTDARCFLVTILISFGASYNDCCRMARLFNICFITLTKVVILRVCEIFKPRVEKMETGLSATLA